MTNFDKRGKLARCAGYRVSKLAGSGSKKDPITQTVLSGVEKMS
jgi:hypothetical protein